MRVKISVVHRDFGVDGGGERVTLSLLRALDRTGHDVVLRCIRPPRGASFRERGGGEGTGAGEEGADPPAHEFRRVRLWQAPPAGGGSSSAEAGLFAGTGSDLLLVTDGGFVMESTDARRVLLYANSDLSSFRMGPPLGYLRRPYRLIAHYRERQALRRMLALVRDPRVSVVPNSESTARAYARAARGARIERVVYPPVNLGRFAAMRGRPKERRVATTGRFSPEKRHESAVRVMRRAGARWDAVGNARLQFQQAHLKRLRGMAGPNMHFHVNASEEELDGVLGGAKVYLHPRPESFGIAVVEAVAAGCIPVVPDNSAHPETVPFEGLRYGSEGQAAAAVRGALDGRFDGLLPELQGHARKFSEEAFQRGMLEAVKRHEP